MRGAPRPEGRGGLLRAPLLPRSPPHAVPRKTSGTATEGLAANSAGGPSPKLGVPGAPSVLGGAGGGQQ